MQEMKGKWLLSATLVSVFFLGAGLLALRGQNPPEPNEPRPGTAADRAEDKQQAQALHERIRLDRERLQADVRQFGKNSPQARADRAQLRADKHALKGLHRDMRRDHRIAAHRAEHRRHHRRY